jgi:hypothetical protein
VAAATRLLGSEDASVRLDAEYLLAQAAKEGAHIGQALPRFGSLLRAEERAWAVLDGVRQAPSERRLAAPRWADEESKREVLVRGLRCGERRRGSVRIGGGHRPARPFSAPGRACAHEEVEAQQVLRRGSLRAAVAAEGAQGGGRECVPRVTGSPSAL